ncbi:MAG: type II toxin-antitoxin system VapC family toxin [Nitriliruptoraceae bacterium]
MRLLLDTHVFLWALTAPSVLSEHVRGRLLDPRVPVHVSAVSVWELAIKRRLGRLRDADGIDLAAAITESGFSELPVTGQHAAETEALPDIHRDPFDRLLIAQSLVEDLTLVTRDDRIRSYPDLALLDA